MLHERVKSGSKMLDYLLDGGYEPEIISTIYGPAGSGKTNLAILCAAHCAKKVIYIDTESSLSVERLKQIAPDYTKVLERMIFLRPTSFDEQIDSFKKLKELVKIENDNIGIIIIDTISMLYRLEIGQSKNPYSVNRELGRQLQYLSEIASKKKIPILITNQVYTDIDKNEVKMLGGDILKYWSKCLLELQITDEGNRRAVLRKHRSLPEGREMTFKIVQTGIIGTQEKKKFGLF